MAKQEKKPELIKVKAVAAYAFTNKPNPMSEGTYTIELTQLSPKAVEALEFAGIEVKTKDKSPEWKFYITGKSKFPIKAVDEDGDPVEDIIGNGSVVTATIKPYDWSFKNKKGTSAGVAKLVINELVPYGGGADDNDEPAL